MRKSNVNVDRTIFILLRIAIRRRNHLAVDSLIGFC